MLFGHSHQLVLATLGVGTPTRLIAEFAEQPGAEDGPKSWKGSDGLGGDLDPPVERPRHVSLG